MKAWKALSGISLWMGRMALLLLAADMPLSADVAAMPSDTFGQSRDSASRVTDSAPVSARPPPPDSVPGDEPIELKALKVKGKRPSKAQRLRHSAEAVKVIETREAGTRAADMGEVLARNEGVGIRRDGGLGSGTRLSLAGLTDDQVRFFLDGIPLEWAGYPFGIANVPVNLIERVEIYRGVVPIRFGADALGGAVNLATADSGKPLSLSFQSGSFGTQRVAFSGSRPPGQAGFFARLHGFFDRADNDYPVDVEATDSRGRLYPATVPRFHDGYWAAGGSMELGLVGRPWAKRLSLRAFSGGHRKDIQHNAVMERPYGQVDWGKRTTGAALRYEQDLGPSLSLDAVGGYTYGQLAFADTGSCYYDWFGACIYTQTHQGEIEPGPRDQVQWEHAGFARMNAAWKPDLNHTFRLAVAPGWVRRQGEERHPLASRSREAVEARRELFTGVGGIEYELDGFGGRLENIAFAKGYLQKSRSEEPLPGGIQGRRDRDTYRPGAGDVLRLFLSKHLYAKTSYEWATRLPRPDEVFGDGVLIHPNLELKPETSHNANLGLTLEGWPTRLGFWRCDANVFLRETDRLIDLRGNDRHQIYRNVHSARSFGLEAASGWTSSGEALSLDGNATWMEFRKTSPEGPLDHTEGDRIPNRPYLFANGSFRLQSPDFSARRHGLALFWDTRFVHEFFRGWESYGAREHKQTVPSQLSHSASLAWRARAGRSVFSTTLEAQNLTDARTYDFYGVQRPGRAFHIKCATEIR